MTDCEKREIIRSLAMGVSFEETSVMYEMSVDEVNDFYKSNKSEVDEEIQLQKRKYGE